MEVSSTGLGLSTESFLEKIRTLVIEINEFDYREKSKESLGETIFWEYPDFDSIFRVTVT